MKKVFWVLLHGFTVFVILSGLTSYFGMPTHAEKPQDTNTITVVQGAVTFPVSNDAADPNKVLDLVNKLRRDNGLEPLVGDLQLSKLASDRADDMVNRGYYAHKNPDGKNFFDLMTDGGYAPHYACENLSLEPSKSETVSYDGWLTSTRGHKECMLEPSVSRAGYASRKLYELPTSQGMTSYYLVVAIHASQD
jgi:uncharacterized protein YkwD